LSFRGYVLGFSSKFVPYAVKPHSLPMFRLPMLPEKTTTGSLKTDFPLAGQRRIQESDLHT
ncbi:hypothetical protein, partial [Kingella oralis]|uniref:hypothetical protein n=1 Tax=Kingella oralis TaxID=505 RepID=UPI0034E46009